MKSLFTIKTLNNHIVTPPPPPPPPHIFKPRSAYGQGNDFVGTAVAFLVSTFFALLFVTQPANAQNGANNTLTDDFVTTWRVTAGAEAARTITIPTTGGGYDYTVNWGDDTTLDTNQTGNAMHIYAAAGTYTVRISGSFPRIYFNAGFLFQSFPRGNFSNAQKIIAINQWGTGQWTSMKGAFANARNLAGEQASDAPNLSQVTDMAGMFVEAQRFNQNISSWDVSEVKDMESMFHDARAFNQNIGNWDVSEVKDMESMFHDARAFNQNIGNWDVSEVKDMESMFHDARAFNQNIGNWDVSEVKDMESMFHDARAFNQNIGNWDVSEVKDMNRMFYRARAFNQNIGNWNVSGVTDMGGMFQYAAKFNQNIGNWDVSDVTRMSSMFQGATTFNQNIGNWDVSGVTDMSSMFWSATTFNQDIGRWDVSSVRHMSNVFRGATTFNQDISRWDVSPNGDRDSVSMDIILSGATAFTQNLGLWYISHDLVDLAILPTVEARDEVATFHGQNAFLARGRSGRYVLSGEDSHFFTLTQPTISAQGALADAAVLTINEDPGVVGTEYRITISAVKHPATSRVPYGTNNHREFTFVVNNRPDITSHMMASLKEIMLAENTQKVTDIAASDMDMDTLTYTLSAHDVALFEITDAGALNFKTDYIPDYENPRNSRGKIDEEADQEYSVLVTVSDGVSTDKQKITVTIADANDAPTLADTTLQIAENSANEMAVETITGEDQDATAPNNELTYSITDGNINEAFAISSSTGEITVNGEDKIDFETTAVYTLTVQVADGGNPSLTDTATITVNVNDVNEAPTLADETFELLENSVDGASVGDIMGQDPDIEAPNNELTYSITDGNTDGAFAISSSTGEITVNGEDKIDFETTAVYTLTVQVADGGSSDEVTDGGTPALTDTATITVNVTDVNEAPTLEDETLQVSENSVNETVVGTITGEDQDTTAPNNVLTYSITDGNINEAFAISSSTGEITVNGEDKIDFETISSYELIVTVADGGNPSLTDTATITVNVNDVNEAPIITSSNTFTVAENQPAVATLTVTDVDTGDTPTFSETIAGTDAAAFALTTAGVLTFNGNPDFETKSSYSITITVADGGNPSLTDTQDITVNVNDVNEAPTLENTTLQVSENSVNGANVGDITGQDPDTTVPFNTLTYSITDGNTNEAFAISDAGEITVNGDNKIDFETISSYELIVTVADGGTPALIGTATIMVNVNDVNEAPIITSLNTFTVAENQPAVATLTVTDVDTGDTPTFSETITGTDAAAFTLTTGGVLTFNDNPNFETKSSYSITITVADGGNPSLTDTQDITVNVNDVNEAPTLENTTLQIAENSVDGASVGDIMGQDPDTEAPNNELTYSIIDGDTDGAFAISDAGEITVNGDNKIDFETTAVYTLTVQVADGGTSALTDTATITVNVNDVNEAPTLENTTLQIAENSANEMAVETITGEDQDTTAPNNVLTYSITDGNINEAFAISSSTGEITVNGEDKIDFETISSYELIVTVADGGNPSLTDTATITVNVNDVNEAPTLADETFELLENLVDGASVGDIMGQDPDIEAPNNELTYSITDGNTNEAFAISDAGEITVNGDNKIDFETTPFYTLTVQVDDGGTPALIGTATIMVNVNLAAPDISPSVPTLIATVGTAITPITITHNGGAVDSYSIMSNLPAGLSINPSSGEISGTPTAIAEAIPYTITATNNAGMAMATVTITVNAPDTTAPIITLTGANPQTIELGVDYTELGATTDDGSDVSIDSSAYRNVVGTYIITYTATDGTNQATATRTVNVVDTTAPVAPVITLQTTLTNENTITITGTTVEGSTVTLTQNNIALTPTIITSSDGTWSVDVTLIQGANTFTATATDQAGNISDVSNSVTVTLDNTAPDAPVITLQTTLTNENTITITGTTVEGSTVTLTQNDNVLTSTVTIDSDGTWSVDVTLIQGANTFTATATDQAGNISDVSNSVTVTLDNAAPIITLTGANPQTIELGVDYTELGATTDDGSDVSIDSSAYRNVVGTYIITYTATDGTNQATATRTVNIVDTTAPIITLTGANPQTIELGVDYTELGATTDDGSVVSIDSSAYRNVVGTYIITYTATDGTNQATATRTVNVVDTTAPVAPVITLQTTLTNENTITITGTTVEGSTVTLTQNDIALTPTIITSSDGTWSVDVTLIQGANTFTATATDQAGNISDVSNSVTVTLDNAAPIITLTGANPQTIELGVDYTELGATTDDGSDVSIDSSAYRNVVGTYIITYTATDGTNQATATRTVNVVDTTAPIITLTGANPQTIESGVDYTELGATTDDGSEVSIDSSAYRNVVGTYIITYTATDGTNQATATRTVNVVDTTAPDAPVITLQTTLTNENTITITGTTVEGSTVTLTQNDIALTPTIITSSDGTWSVDVTLIQGANTFTATATDQAGNISDVSNSVTVTLDNAAPIITLTGANPQTIESGADYTELGATTDDGSVVSVDSSAYRNVVGTYIITYTATDGTNQATATRTVNVVDTTAPIITLTGANPQTIESGADYTELGATTDDGSDVSIDSSAYRNVVGTYIITYTATDGTNQATATRTVNVVDTTAPIITLTGANPQTIESGADYTELGATTDDGSDVSIDSSAYRNVVGTYIITYTATDGTNQATATRTVNVVDTTAPIITLTGANPQTIESGADYTELGATTDDGSDVSIDSSAYRNVVGTYIITYTATDGTNQATATRTVNVVDTTAPIITLTGANPQTIESGADYTELGATTDDGSDVSVDSSAYRNVVGTYIITYTATDGTNQATATRTVNVVDTTAPVAPVITSPTTLTNENTITITGTTVEGSTVTLTQNDNVLTSTVTIDSDGAWSVDVTLIQGANTFTATATDQAGNISDVSNSVTVTLDNTAPIITLTGANPQTIESGADYTELGATTDDGSDVSIDSSAYRNVVGTYIITYTATDGTNQATATRTVNVVDTTAPIITLTGANPQTIESGADYTELGATTDDGSDVSIDSSAYRNVVGTYIITYTATDGTNQATATRTVNVVDTTAPIITLTGANPQTIESGADYTELGATTDDGSDVSVDSSAYRNVVGTYIITYTATDGTNQATATRTVNVVDTTAPVAPVITSPTTLTNENTITITGTTVEGSTVTLTQNDNVLTSTVTIDFDGIWSVDVTLIQGANTFTATATDQAGNISDVSNSVTVTLDNTAPVAPVITSPTTLTNENTITITGTTVEGSTVTLTQNDNVLTSTVTIDSDGAWSVDVTLIQGANTFTATATDQAGNISDVSNSVTVTLDNAAPIITLTGANPQTIELGVDYTELGATTDDGSMVSIDSSAYRNVVGTYIITYTATDGTNQATATRTVNVVDTTAPIITLTGANPQTIESGADYTELGATTDDGSVVSIDSSAYRNVVGTYIITYTATDGTNQATATRTVNVVDTTAPDAPVITSPTTLTNENTITITGTTVEGSTVTLTQNDNVLTSTVTIDFDGIWSVDVTLIQGANTFTATATDQAGNISDVSNSVTVTLDNTAPIITLTGANPQTIESGADYTELGATTDDGSVVSIDSSAYRNVVGTYIITYTATDGTNQATATRTVNVVDTTAPTVAITTTAQTVNEASFTLEGTVTVEAGATVDVLKDGNSIGAASVSGGTWSKVVTLTDGANVFTATATDATDNTSDATDAVTVTLDSDAPTVAITTAAQTVNEASFTLEGTVTVEAGAMVDVLKDGNSIGAASVSGGTWSKVVTLTDGANVFTATATDATDNTSDATAAVTVTLDSDAPTVAITTTAQTVNEASFTLAGTVEAGATVDVLKDGNSIGAASVSGGTWSKVVTLTDGANVFTATATDATDNTSDATAAVTVTLDSDAPTVAITTTAQTVNEASFTLEGTVTVEAGAMVDVLKDGNSIGAASVSGGTWSKVVTLTDGDNVFTATASDAAGNTSAASEAVTVTLDMGVPAAPVITAPTTPTAKATESVTVSEKTIEVGGSSITVESRTIQVEVTTGVGEVPTITRFSAAEVSSAKLKTIVNRAVADDGIDLANVPSIDSTITPTLVVNTAVDITVNEGACPAKGCEVTLSYEAGDVPAGKDPYVFHYDETKGKWEALPHVRRDTINRKVTALATSFSPFALFNASRADKLAKQLNEEILPRLTHVMLGSTVSAVNSRMDDTFSGTPQVASYQFDGQTVQLDSQTGLSANLQNTVAQKLPNYIESLKDGTMDWKEMLSRSAFVMPLNAAGGAGSTAGATVWGGGDYNRMSGKFSNGDWKGEVFSAQLGIDQRVRKDLLAGGLVSWSKGDVDYTLTDKNGKETRGDYTHQITSVHPYFARSNDEVDLWGSVGYGQGKLAIKQQSPTEDSERSSDTRLLSLSAGGSGRLSQSGLKLKSDIILAQVDIAESADKKIPADKLNSQRLRLLLEMGSERPLSSGGHFKPLLEVGLRYDGGVGESSGIGAVLNLGGHYANATGLTVEGKLHTLLGQDDYQEWGIQGTIRQQANANGQGLSFSLNPSYGTVGISTNQVWQQELADDNNGTSNNSARLNVNMGYGLFTAGGLLTPYSEVSMSDSNHYRLGLRWKPSSPLSLHLYGERETSNNSDRILLEGRIRF